MQKPMTAAADNQRWLDSPSLWIPVAVVLGAIVRLAIAPHFDFYGDEFFTLEWCQKSFREIQSSFGPGITMHLYILLMKGWGTLVGYSPWTMKLPSLVAGIALIPLLARLGSRWFNHQAAAVAIAILVTSSPLINTARTARVYALLALGVVVSMMIFSRALRTGSVKYLLLNAIVNASLMALSLHAVYIFIIQAASAALEFLCPPRISFRRLAGLAASLGLSAVLSLLFYSGALPKIIALFTASSVSTSASVMLSSPLQYRPKVFLQLWLPFSWNHAASPVIMLLCLALGVFVACRWYGARGRLLVLWAVIPPFFYLIVPFGFVPDSIARYLVPVVAAQILLVALGALWIVQLVPFGKRLSPTFAFSIALILTLIPNAFRNQLFIQSEPSSLTLRHVAEIAQPGDVVTSYPGHYQAMIDLHRDLNGGQLSALVNQPSLPAPGRLIIILRSVPKVKNWWLEYFEGYQVGGPGYTHNIIVLVSPRLSPGPKALIEPMHHFYYGFLKTMATEGTLHRYPSIQLGLLRRVHSRLARLADLAGNNKEYQEHLLLVQNPESWLIKPFDSPEIMKVLDRDGSQATVR